MKRLLLIAMVVLLSSSIALAQDFCKGLADFDQDVDADDVTVFLSHFGRSPFFNPCPPDGPGPVQKTGQTTSYYEGDDGGVGKGVEWPNPRFTDNGNGTVTDNLTGLIWLKNANCFGPRDWIQAITDCNALFDGQCGLTDGSSGGQWRLPNRFELASLLDMQYYRPPLSNTVGTGQWKLGDPFTNLLTGGNYWSSTTYQALSGYAWYLNMYSGGFEFEPKVNVNSLWPVRGGH
jgi:hypothetical protein